MRRAWTRQTINKFYTLGGDIIQEVNQAKYLGVMITSELGWFIHIDIISNKATICLSFDVN